MLLDDDFSKVLFYGQRVLAQEPGNGRLIAPGPSPGSRPRIKAILRVPCSPARPNTTMTGHGALQRPTSACYPVMGGAFWLDDPGTLVLTFRGGARAHRIGISAPARVDRIKPRARTTLRLPIPQGASGFDAQLDWQQSGPDYPELVDARLVTGDGIATNLLY